MRPEDRPPTSSAHLPLTLLSLAIAIFLGAQVAGATQAAKTIRWQLGNLDKQIENFKDAQKQYAEQIAKREELVKQSGLVQSQYTSLLNEVIELAKDDEDSQKVVQKWNIQRSQPPAKAEGEAATPAPAAAPTK